MNKLTPIMLMGRHIAAWGASWFRHINMFMIAERVWGNPCLGEYGMLEFDLVKPGHFRSIRTAGRGRGRPTSGCQAGRSLNCRSHGRGRKSAETGRQQTERV